MVRVNADKAVTLMRFYLGSVDHNSLRDQQKLYTRTMKEIERLARKVGSPIDIVWNQVETEARRRGIVRPLPGRDV